MDPSVSDAQLWLRAASNDGVAFGELFKRHSTPVYNHCFRRTSSWSTAEDLTSIVFLEAWRRRSDVTLQSDSILPWLLALANNVLRNSDRSFHRYNRLLIKMRSNEQARISTQHIEDRIDDESKMAVVLQLLSQQSIEDREVISICDWAGLSYAEAAVTLELPIGTVRSRLARARQRLRSNLELMSDRIESENRGLSTHSSRKE
jgi:RNA polymerase sigma factor (sigma-70 family)